MVEKFSRELKLDAAQKDAVRAVLESRRESMRAFKKETGARFDEIRLSMDSEIKKVLTPEQQKAFDAMHERMAARRRRAEER
ncbi:MAG: hypothetical protein A2X36_03470 [Elusimicrobia bacterium GWA2_69_24]|nr:MAG: hypothetical protein A2X36_03470 [Elusimicrobia bacterium GWA2_69_24]